MGRKHKTQVPPPCTVTIRMGDGRLWQELSADERADWADRFWESFVRGPGTAYLRARAAREASAARG